MVVDPLRHGGYLETVQDAAERVSFVVSTGRKDFVLPYSDVAFFPPQRSTYRFAFPRIIGSTAHSIRTTSSVSSRTTLTRVSEPRYSLTLTTNHTYTYAGKIVDGQIDSRR